MKKTHYFPKRIVAVGAFLSLLVGCTSFRSSPQTTNISWAFERNLVLVNATVGGRAGSFVVGTAASQTVLDSSFPADAGRRGRVGIDLGERYNATVTPVRADLGGIADGILGADAWRGSSLTVDYQRGLLVLGTSLDPITEGVRFRFRETPAVQVRIDGVETTAVIDTASPDTILLPSRTWGAEGRRAVDLRIGKTRFGAVDARVAPVGEVRLGNRILAHFLVTVDYPRREVTLWRYGAAPPPR